MSKGPVYLVRAWKPGCTERITLPPTVPGQPGEIVEVATLKGLECVFANILNVVVRLAGIALFVMLLIGSFKLMTAGGDAKKVQAAQQTLTYAVIGLVVIIGAWFVFRLIEIFTGVPVLKFEIFSR